MNYVKYYVYNQESNKNKSTLQPILNNHMLPKYTYL